MHRRGFLFGNVAALLSAIGVRRIKADADDWQIADKACAAVTEAREHGGTISYADARKQVMESFYGLHGSGTTSPGSIKITIALS